MFSFLNSSLQDASLNIKHILGFWTFSGGPVASGYENKQSEPADQKKEKKRVVMTQQFND